MGSPPPTDESTAPPERSRWTQIATWLERGCTVGAQLSLPGIVLTSGLLLFYVSVGLFATTLGFWTPGYPFLSLAADPVFTLLGFLSGLSICIGTGSILILFMMRGIDTTRGHISVFAACTGFGFGASVIRFTVPTVLKIVATLG
jgi:hypothetical protein